MPTTTANFVPDAVDATCWPELQPLFRSLIDRDVNSGTDLERWLEDRSDLDATCSEGAAGLYIAMTCNTDKPECADAYTAYVENVRPELTRIGFELDKKQAALSEQFGIGQASFRNGRYVVLTRDVKAEVELFRDENVPIQTQLDKLGQDYQAIVGKMSVEFDGKERTIPQMAVYYESTDRAQREQAWKHVADRRAQDIAQINTIFDKQIKLRDQLARNAGFDDYIGYTFVAKHRFDYTPDHCSAFHDACEQHVVPFLRDLEKERKQLLGVDPLRPWDLSVDVKGRAPLRPFVDGADLVSKTRAVFDAFSPDLGAMFRELGDNGVVSSRHLESLLDLDSRKGKGPGGYQYMQDRSGRPFIFMNAAGTQKDVHTMVHEAGHAFHSQFCRDEPLVAYRHAPIEFCEVASMSMELLTMPYWKGDGRYFTDATDDQRAKRQQIEGAVSVLPWIATIDAFQHWIYAHPNHTPQERSAYWLTLHSRFGSSADWSGFEHLHETNWQRQSHLFNVPFYYIEYGIAQLGALGLWIKSLEEGERFALDAYARAMRLGGSRPLPDLFEAAGLPFDFGPEIVGRLVDRVRKELKSLPA